MARDLLAALRPTALLLILFTLVLGLAYPLAVTGIAQAVLPGPANGSLVRQGDRVVGSALIAQPFAGARYFHPRPSAAGKAGYDAANSGATNLAPGAKDLADAIRTRVAEARSGGATGAVPADLVTTSGSGLDPHLSPEAALAQAPRVAAARGLPLARVQAAVASTQEAPLAGFLGEPRVNVLLLNLRLDAEAAAPQGAAR